MNTKELYLRANALAPLEQNEFLDRLGECLRYLLNTYPRALLTGGKELCIPSSLAEECNINPRYRTALLRGIYALGTGSGTDRSAFIDEADKAYLALWREAASGRQIGKPAAGGAQ